MAENNSRTDPVWTQSDFWELKRQTVCYWPNKNRVPTLMLRTAQVRSVSPCLLHTAFPQRSSTTWPMHPSGCTHPADVAEEACFNHILKQLSRENRTIKLVKLTWITIKQYANFRLKLPIKCFHFFWTAIFVSTGGHWDDFSSNAFNKRNQNPLVAQTFQRAHNKNSFTTSET